MSAAMRRMEPLVGRNARKGSKEIRRCNILVTPDYGHWAFGVGISGKMARSAELRDADGLRSESPKCPLPFVGREMCE
jgi:hypothetical protein